MLIKGKLGMYTDIPREYGKWQLQVRRITSNAKMGEICRIALLPSACVGKVVRLERMLERIKLYHALIIPLFCLYLFGLSQKKNTCWAIVIKQNRQFFSLTFGFKMIGLVFYLF